MKKRALVAMSGGVDSAVSAYLAKKEGYECIGATMILCNRKKAIAEANDARRVCEKLGIEHYTIDYTKEFEDIVINSFVNSYMQGKTPNPCIVCNQSLKFGLLFSKAKELGCDTVVTGHYAIAENGVIKKAKDLKKDQSYVLWSIPKDNLGSVYFPLGYYTKDEVRKIALQNGFVSARKSDSQDICFVADGDYASFIENHTGKKAPKGNFVDMQGNVLGTHEGIIRYTVGQRKGLGIAFGKPMYVKGKSSLSNEVVLCSDRELFNTEVTASDVNILCDDQFKNEIRAKAKIRYNQTEQDCTVYPMENGRMKIVFDVPQRAAAPGQSVVVYMDDVVFGGGVID